MLENYHERDATRVANFCEKKYADAMINAIERVQQGPLMDEFDLDLSATLPFARYHTSSRLPSPTTSLTQDTVS